MVDASDHVGEPDTYVVVFGSQTVLYSTDPGANPVSATVTCTLQVSGDPRATATFTGTGVVAGAEAAQVTVRRDQWLVICTTVDVTSDGTPTASWCDGPRDGPPPADLHTVAGEMLRLVPGHESLCIATRAAAPLTPDVYAGPVVSPDGDVGYDDDAVLDCPASR